MRRYLLIILGCGQTVEVKDRRTKIGNVGVIPGMNKVVKEVRKGFSSVLVTSVSRGGIILMKGKNSM